MGGRTAHVDIEVELVHEAFVRFGDGAALAQESEGVDYGERSRWEGNHVRVLVFVWRGWRGMAGGPEEVGDKNSGGAGFAHCAVGLLVLDTLWAKCSMLHFEREWMLQYVKSETNSGPEYILGVTS